MDITRIYVPPFNSASECECCGFREPSVTVCSRCCPCDECSQLRLEGMVYAEIGVQLYTR